jgi:biopolymer transport protein ExbB
MQIDTAYFHHVCINALYASAVLLIFVFIERLVYYGLLNYQASRLGSIVSGDTSATNNGALSRRNLFARSLAEYVKAQDTAGTTRARLEDLSAALFIKVSSHVTARLWMLDTIVTAAPLLGLLGTILGIMDTFNALSSGGISDPAAVSRGIAAALLATAIGIGTALIGLLGYNILHRMSEHLTEEFKRLILVSYKLAGLAPASTDVRSGVQFADHRPQAAPAE